MSSERPEFGGKRPRDIYRNLPSPPNFSVVNFLDDDGQKTTEQEVVPMLWIITTKKNQQCYWPRDRTISRKQLTTLVTTETPPNKKEFHLYPVRILHSNCTFAEATAKFEVLAIKSTVEDDQDADADMSSDDKTSHPPPKARESRYKKKKSEPTEQEGSSFDFEDDDDMNVINSRSPSPLAISDGSPKTSVGSQSSKPRSSLGGHTSLPTRRVFSGDSTSAGGSKSGSQNNSGIVPKQLFKPVSSPTARNTPTFTGECCTSCVSKGEFEAFERKMLNKLNMLIGTVEEGFKNVKSNLPSQTLISMPATISSRCSLPATDVKTLENLDSELKNYETKIVLATYLSQLGGRNHSDFLGRALPKIISDEVCCYTNWSGSAIPSGTQDSEGNEIPREFKKTFANLTSLVDMFCVASRMVSASISDKEVETYIKKWLLSYKDRRSPRSHQKIPNSSRSPNKGKHSPKKRK